MSFWIFDEGNLLDHSFRMLHKTSGDFRQFLRPAGAIHLQPMATPWELVFQKEYALQGHPELRGPSQMVASLGAPLQGLMFSHV